MTTLPLWLLTAQAQAEAVIQTDSFDIQHWQEALNLLPTLANLNTQARTQFGGQPLRDGFTALYKAQPRLTTPPPAGLEALNTLFQRAMQTPEWQALHGESAGNLITAAVGSHTLMQLFHQLPAPLQEQLNAAAAAHQTMQAQAERVAQLEALQAHLEQSLHHQPHNPQTEATLDQLHPQLTAAQGDLALAEQVASQVAQTAIDSMNQSPATLAQMLGRAVEATHDETHNTVNFIKGFTLAAGGDPQRLSGDMVQTALDLLAHYPHLSKVGDLLGWARPLAAAPSRQTPLARTAITGILPQPLDPAWLYPGELVALAQDPDSIFHLEALARLAENKALHWKIEGQSRLGRGPVILVVDQSGSMGAPEDIAVVVALQYALIQNTRRTQRSFVCIPFSGNGEWRIWQAPAPGIPDPASLAEHLRQFYDGGTEPYEPVLAAARLIQSNPSYHRADILLVTDGMFARPTSAFLEALHTLCRDHATRIVVVTVGTHQSVPFADQQVHVAKLFLDKQAILEIAKTVL